MTITERQFKKLVFKKQQEGKQLAKLIEEFLLEAQTKSPEEIKNIFDMYDAQWRARVSEINKINHRKIASKEAFVFYIKTNGYKNIITKPLPIAAKKEVLRIIKVIEGKSEFAWKLRQVFYKIMFLLARVFYLFSFVKVKKKEEPKQTRMKVVK